MILDILNGCQPEVTSFVWVARDGGNFDTNNMFNRQFVDLDKNPLAKMALGDLITVELDKTDRVKLTFGKPVKQRKSVILPVVTTLTCDQLVVAIGQESHPLTRSLKGFVPCQLERELSDLTETEILPLGTHSSDGTIMCWGAAGVIGTGLDDSRSFIDVGLKHAQTLPRESRANVGIFRSSIMIEKMVELLRSLYPTKFISTDKSSHRYDLPDINRASRSELYEIIRETMKTTITAEACLKLVDKILEIRSQLPTGLEDIDVLAKEVPAPVLKALKKAYVPFYIEEIVEPSMRVELSQLVSVPTSIVPEEISVSVREKDEMSGTVLVEKPQAKIKISDSSDRFFNRSTPSLPPTRGKGEFNTLVEALRDEEDENIQLPIITIESDKEPKKVDTVDENRVNPTEIAVYN
ncbi:hypothetical protein [Legionella tunisiensis]|uniref:hypothetical protein n=1 Tax=Legionella tunisiensis TaxID=1034944 RepID=UPI0002F0ABF3|nr:hypothetical protein [Legionella tunisiensis]